MTERRGVMTQRGDIFSQQLDIHLCRECDAVATRFFSEDFPTVGRTIFRGNYCGDHEYTHPDEGAL